MKACRTLIVLNKEGLFYDNCVFVDVMNESTTYGLRSNQNVQWRAIPLALAIL